MRPQLIILASQSPRRRQLLQQAGMPFEIHVAQVEETAVPGEEPEAMVRRLSCLKARAVAASHPLRTVIGADTVVVLDGRAMGKPGNLDEARRTLAALSGRTHRVLTGVTIVHGASDKTETWCCATDVTFKTLTPDIIEAYIACVNVLDKAGAYGIQAHGDMIVDAIDGLMSNVIGLPVEEVVPRLAEER